MQKKRAPGTRRWQRQPEFPLRDSQGVVVFGDRRRIRDRRLPNTSLEERLLMLSEMPRPEPERGEQT